MPQFYSPNGNCEIWDTKPEGYFTESEWIENHPQPAPTRQETYYFKYAQIRDNAEEILNDYVWKYGALEIQTWDLQVQEANAFLADPTSDVPFIRKISESRNIPLDTLVEKIIEKHTAWINFSGKIIGQRSKYTEALKATEQLSDEEALIAISNIVPDYKLD